MTILPVISLCDCTQVLTPCHNREFGQGEGLPDSYTQHSVAPKLQPAVGAPTRLWAEPENEPEPDSRLHPLLSDSYLSCPDSQGGRLIKRKVLRYTLCSSSCRLLT